MASKNVEGVAPGGVILTDNELLTFTVTVVYSDEQQFEFPDVIEIRRRPDKDYIVVQADDTITDIPANTYRYLQIAEVWKQ